MWWLLIHAFVGLGSWQGVVSPVSDLRRTGGGRLKGLPTTQPIATTSNTTTIIKTKTKNNKQTNNKQTTKHEQRTKKKKNDKRRTEDEQRTTKKDEQRTNKERTVVFVVGEEDGVVEVSDGLLYALYQRLVLCKAVLTMTIIIIKSYNK